VLVIGALVELLAVKLGIESVPDSPNPIVLFEFVQE
jgi:hypothetical protein